jgi:hypothetical protein
MLLMFGSSDAKTNSASRMRSGCAAVHAGTTRKTGPNMFYNSARCSTVVHGFTGFACKTHVIERARQSPLATCSIRTFCRPLNTLSNYLMINDYFDHSNAIGRAEIGFGVALGVTKKGPAARRARCRRCRSGQVAAAAMRSTSSWQMNSMKSDPVFSR